MWSFVQNKNNKYWIWLALDVETREIVAVHVGAHNEQAAQKLWELFPFVYRQWAVSYTDFWQVYQCVFPRKIRQRDGTK